MELPPDPSIRGLNGKSRDPVGKRRLSVGVSRGSICSGTPDPLLGPSRIDGKEGVGWGRGEDQENGGDRRRRRPGLATLWYMVPKRLTE